MWLDRGEIVSEMGSGIPSPVKAMGGIGLTPKQSDG